MTELNLICAARDGNRQAIEALLLQNERWLKALIYGIVGRDFEDVFQDMCLKVLRTIKGLREPECFRSWLSTLARREAINWLRQQKKNDAVRELETQGSQSDPSNRSVLQQLEHQDQIEQVLSVIQRLPEKYREILLLQYSQGLSYKQIAEVLDVPLTTVQIRLVRAKRMVLEALTPSPNGRST